jgi:hypothetical protein
MNVIDTEEMSEVGIKTCFFVTCAGEREPVCKLFGFAPRKSVDPHHRPPRVVRPVPRPGIQLPGGIKTCLERRNNRIVWDIDVGSVEPSNRPCQSDSRVECLWVGDVSDDPRYASRVIGVCRANNVKVLGLQPWFGFLNLYIPERVVCRWRWATEELPDPPGSTIRTRKRPFDPTSDPLPWTTKSGGYRCLEWTRVRRRPSDHDPDEKRDSKASETDEGVRNPGVDRTTCIDRARRRAGEAPPGASPGDSR